MTEAQYQRPEGALIERTRLSLKPKLSGNKAAERMGLSATRWHQIIKGFQWVSAGVAAPVKATPQTLAGMAEVVGVTPDQLRAVDRADAAEVLEVLLSGAADRAEPATDTVAALTEIRDRVDALLDQLRRPPTP